MSDLIEDAGPGPTNVPELTVAEISGKVKRLIEGEFGRVRVRGEVGRVMLARSGHLYFDLKDERNVLAAVSWKGQVARLSVRPEEGMEVVATGRLTTFASQSKYQLNVEQVEIAGEGALMALLEKRKKKLAAEGLFAPERKKPLPYLPEVIGVVTSPSGAVIRDILHRLRERFPRHVLIWPVAVQGERCAPEVARAIRGFNALPEGGPIPRPDLIIVARGGGSVEDLWGFNEEEVARAAAESRIPVISAVGHETDTTLIDYAADKRAPTPTAAAEIAVPVRRELMGWLEEQGARLARAIDRLLRARAQRLADLARALPRPERLTESAAQRLDRAAERLPAALRHLAQARQLAFTRAAARLTPQALARRLESEEARLASLSARTSAALARRYEAAAREHARAAARLSPEQLARKLSRAQAEHAALARRLERAAQAQLTGWRQRLDALERMRQTLGYRETLRRGYAVVHAGPRVVSSAVEAARYRKLEIEFHDGRLPVAPLGGPELHGETAKPRPPAARRKTPGPDEGQGSLF